jgi:hypothetical protein
MLLAKEGAPNEDIAVCLQALNVSEAVWTLIGGVDEPLGTPLGTCQSMGEISRVRISNPPPGVYLTSVAFDVNGR